MRGDLQQVAGFTSNLLQTFFTSPLTRTGERRTEQSGHGVSTRDLQLDDVDLKASDMWVSKIKLLNRDVESLRP